MIVPHQTPHMVLRWISVSDVARRLKLSRWAAIRKIKAHQEEMGAESVPYDNRTGAHWRVRLDCFEAWMKARGLAA